MLRILLPLLVCVGLAAGEGEDDPSPWDHRASGLVFPTAIGTLTKRGRRDYQPDTWGSSVRYENEAGVYADLYVYTKDLDTVTDGVAGEAVLAEFKRSCGELDGMLRAGRYVEVAELPAPTVPLAERFLLKSFTFRRVDVDSEEVGEPLHSHVALRGHNGHFLKVRLSYPATAVEAGLGALAAVVAQLTADVDPVH